MRKRDWKDNLTKEIKNFIEKDNIIWANNYPDIAEFWDIELALFMALKVTQNETGNLETIWIILSGYPLPVPELINLATVQRKIIGNARHLLPEFRGQFRWRETIKNYEKIAESLRGFNIDLEQLTFSQKPVTILSNRFSLYEKTLTSTLPYTERSLKWAEAGEYLIPTKNELAPFKKVTISETYASYASNISSHNLVGKSQQEPIKIRWEDLINSACWMDQKWQESPNLKARNWEKRLKDINLNLVNNEQLENAQELTIDGLFNLVGPVGTGKSTLMEVLAVLAVRHQKKHVTIIVPDVVDALNRSQLFTYLGLKVAPILGQSNRIKHLNRLHRACQIEQPESLLNQVHEGFKWVSTSCALTEQIDEVLEPNKYPCLSLRKADKKGDFACPLYQVCPTHKAAIDLVSADIWLATPASLLYTRVPKQINQENIRYGELIYRRSDLIIWDEIDRGMVALDNAFNPYEEVFSFANQIRSKMSLILASKNLSPLKDSNVNKWQKVQTRLNGASDQIYNILEREGSASLKDWLSGIGDFFSDTLLMKNIAKELCGNEESSAYQKLSQEIDNYLTNEANQNLNNSISQEQKDYSVLTNVTNSLILEQETENPHLLLRNWLQENKTITEEWSEEKWTELVERLQFSLLIHALSQSLHIVVNNFISVNQVLELDLEGSSLLNNPPPDFNSVIPASPQGNTLGFQYRNGGNLRFFKCRGIGRWLTLHLHELFADEGIIGPNVMIMSGTSWANVSPGFHVQTPVNGILEPDLEITNKISSESEFALRKFYYVNSSNNEEVRVSGLRGEKRNSALKEIIEQLVKPSGLNNLSPLEVQTNQLPLKRQRILMLTGSYDEAKLVAKFIVELRSEWKDQVLYLVRDDSEDNSNYRSFEKTLRRGNIERFSNTSAWILVAPLLAVERGHNILNEDNEAALGASYFLVRPHPRPDDLNLCLQMLNYWAIDQLNNLDILKEWCGDNFDLVTLGTKFRHKSYREWCRILETEMIISTLSKRDKSALLWNIIVVLNQVIGRLFRGGCPAHVYFCDAAFADILPDILTELSAYFDSSSNISNSEKAIASALYTNFYLPLKRGLDHV